MVHFVGAGSGAADLITVRGARLLAQADLVLYAGSLVNPEVLAYARAEARLVDSAKMTLEAIVEEMRAAVAAGETVVRLHTGDPSLFGAVGEQYAALDRLGIPYDVCPGVSSFCGAAASLKAEYTLPETAQTVILSRAGGRTSVPTRESLESLATHQATMALFLSAGRAEAVEEALLAGGYPPETPVAVVYKATWPQERILRCTLQALSQTVRNAGIEKTALILVGRFLNGAETRSRLYDPAFSTGYREAFT